MTLHQMTQLKRWQVARKQHAPIEYHTWDAVLTVWLMGWMGVPSALLLWQPYGVLLCVAAFFAPAGYARLRERLHRASEHARERAVLAAPEEGQA